MNQATSTAEARAAPQSGRHPWHVRPSLMAFAALTLATAAFLAGRLTAAPAVVPAHPVAGAMDAAGGSQSADAPLLVQAPGDPRELVPLPGPGEAEGVPEECLLLYQDGELYQFGDPGPGDGEPGRGGPRELIPLAPFRPGPGAPGPGVPREPPPPGDPPGTLRAFVDRPMLDH